MSNITKIQIKLDSTRWKKITATSEEHLYVPRFMVTTRISENTSDFDFPFIRLLFKGEELVSIQAYSGIVRELPIYYAFEDGLLSVADLPQLLTCGSEIDEKSRLDYLCFGYVRAQRTLFSSVNSLVAGKELIGLCGSEIIDTQRYRYNSRTAQKNVSSKELLAQLTKVTDNAFAKLAGSLNGREVVLPLSGGYDSRFIAAMLKKAGIENVHCYAWGKPGNYDVQVSKKVAEKLGYSWTNIEYNQAQWQHIAKSGIYRELLNNTSDYSGISGVASLPFLEYLKKENNSNRVMVFGHTGDFIGGGHISNYLHEKMEVHELVDVVLSQHCLVNSFENPVLRQELLAQLTEIASELDFPYRACEAWELQERQAKFITQTNRYYEQLNLSWSMPLWDKEYVEFWSTVPIQYKRNLRLYNKFLNEQLFAPMGVLFESDRRRNKNPLIARLRGRLRNIEMLQKLRMKVAKPKLADEFGFNQFAPTVCDSLPNEYMQKALQVDELAKKNKLGEAKNAYAYLARHALSVIKNR